MNLLSPSNWAAEKQWVIWLIPLVSRWCCYQSEQQQSWMSQHHQQQQFSFVVSDFVAILNASLFCLGTQIPINLAPSLWLQGPILIQLGSKFANWPLPRCVRDHNVYIDDSCCWWRWCWCCCPILTPFDPFDAHSIAVHSYPLLQKQSSCLQQHQSSVSV